MTAPKVDEQGNQGAAAISNAMTKLHRERYGRGPNSVRTVVGHDHVICFLEDIYTPAERTLLEAGEAAAVVEMRLAFQRAMESPFTELIESVTGRRVRAFLSQTHIDPDISCEIFVLEPDGARVPEGVG
jgi:uncharacterized protein YbcI